MECEMKERERGGGGERQIKWKKRQKIREVKCSGEKWNERGAKRKRGEERPETL